MSLSQGVYTSSGCICDWPFICPCGREKNYSRWTYTQPCQNPFSVLMYSCFTPNFPHTLDTSKYGPINRVQHKSVHFNVYFGPTYTFSSVPSLQSWSPSQNHSCTRHSLLWGQRCLVVQTGALLQLSSSERSKQSGWPSQSIVADIHWPLAHLNSVALQPSSTKRRGGGGQRLSQKHVLYKQSQLLGLNYSPVHRQRTTVLFVTAVHTVPIPITEEAAGNAAALVITLMHAALHQLGTSQLIRAVLTLRHTIAHLALRYALLSMRTLELVCRVHMA